MNVKNYDYLLFKINKIRIFYNRPAIDREIRLETSPIGIEET